MKQLCGNCIIFSTNHVDNCDLTLNRLYSIFIKNGGKIKNEYTCPKLRREKENQNMAQQVTKSTMIGELLQINENIAPLLLNIGMHCLGCPSSQMETIEEAAMVHGIAPDELVTQINDFLAKNE